MTAPWTIALSTGERREEQRLPDAVTVARNLLLVAPAGTTASVTRKGAESRYYSVGEDGVPRRAPHPGGRPTTSPDGRRELVAVRLGPEALRALDGLRERWGATRTGAVERALLEAATPPPPAAPRA